MQTADKKALRSTLLAARAALSHDTKQQLDEALCRAIATNKRFLTADALLAYLPIRGEPDLTALFDIAIARGIKVFLPRCEDGGMRFLQYTAKNALTPDRFGILSPAPDAEEAAPTAQTLCIVPGLAAGKDGSRLGYGGGFYDRFLPTFKGTALFAVYEQFLFDTLPHEAHDYPLAHIITEKGER